MLQHDQATQPTRPSNARVKTNTLIQMNKESMYMIAYGFDKNNTSVKFCKIILT